MKYIKRFNVNNESIDIGKIVSNKTDYVLALVTAAKTDDYETVEELLNYPKYLTSVIFTKSIEYTINTNSINSFKVLLEYKNSHKLLNNNSLLSKLTLRHDIKFIDVLTDYKSLINNEDINKALKFAIEQLYYDIINIIKTKLNSPNIVITSNTLTYALDHEKLFIDLVTSFNIKIDEPKNFLPRLISTNNKIIINSAIKNKNILREIFLLDYDKLFDSFVPYIAKKLNTSVGKLKQLRTII